jgi:uncharacterized protein YfaP (DUF2135 family)
MDITSIRNKLNEEIITDKDISIEVHPLVQCGTAYIVDTSYLTVPEFIAFFSPKGTRFLLFVCCQGQKNQAEEKIVEIIRLCNEMITTKTQTVVVDTKNPESKKEHEKRTLH